MRRITTILIAVAAVAGLSLTACSGTDGGDNGGGNGGGTETLTLEVSDGGLPDLGSDYVWEGWLVTSDGPESTGRFSTSDVSDGTITQEVSADLVSSANRYVLSIEPAQGDDPAPSSTKYLAGELSGGSASLTTGIIADFSSTTGQFALKAPTSSNAPDDDNMGIWFINPDGSMPPAPGFSNLPDLSDTGWNYEGWVVDTSGDSPMPVTTGKFADNSSPATSADQDGSGPGAGSNSEMFPPRPGSDFVTSGSNDEGYDLTSGDWRVVVSVEPQPDNGAAPFALKPWAADISSGASTGEAISLSYNGSSLPTATVTVE